LGGFLLRTLQTVFLHVVLRSTLQGLSSFENVSTASIRRESDSLRASPQREPILSLIRRTWMQHQQRTLELPTLRFRHK
jgi:hypothetical protein